MYVCVCVCVCVCIYIYIYKYVCMYVCMHVYVRMYVYIHVHRTQKAIVSGIGNTSVSGMVYSYGLGPLMRVSLIWYTVMDEDLARPAAFERWPRLCAQVRILV
jgi:hypothetical protein